MSMLQDVTRSCMWPFPKLRVPLWGPYTTEYRLLGSVLESLWKLKGPKVLKPPRTHYPSRVIQSKTVCKPVRSLFQRRVGNSEKTHPGLVNNLPPSLSKLGSRPGFRVSPGALHCRHGVVPGPRYDYTSACSEGLRHE